LVATGAGVGLAAATGALVLGAQQLGLDIVDRLWAVNKVDYMVRQMA